MVHIEIWETGDLILYLTFSSIYLYCCLEDTKEISLDFPFLLDDFIIKMFQGDPRRDLKLPDFHKSLFIQGMKLLYLNIFYKLMQKLHNPNTFN